MSFVFPQKLVSFAKNKTEFINFSLECVIIIMPFNRLLNLENNNLIGSFCQAQHKRCKK